MSVRVTIPDHVYEGYGKLLGCRDAGPGITGFLKGYLAFLDGYQPFPVSSEIVEDKDYSADWEALGLAEDPDDAVLSAAKALLITRKGEPGALRWIQEKQANGINRTRAFLVKWYRDNSQ